MSNFFDMSISVRLRNDEYKKLTWLAAENPDLYDNPSHAARCLIIRGLRGDKDRNQYESKGVYPGKAPTRNK